MIRSLFLIFFLISGTATAAPSITLDLNSGQVLSHKQAFVKWHPASLTKLMTAYTAFRAVEAGELALNSPVVLSSLAVSQPASHTGYPRGTVMKLEDALKLLLVKSANDIAVAIAETVSGSVPAFASRMNSDAQRLGMLRSNFVNPHGLHNERQVVAAYDMALLAQALHKRYPQYAAMFATPRVEAPMRKRNSKEMVRGLFSSYNLMLERFRGADGMKTGFVCASGYNMVAAATRSGRRIATVVLGRNSQTERTTEAARLLTFAFQQPLNVGTAIVDMQPTGNEPISAINLRSEMCSKAAWAKRYNPKPENAIVNSPWLQDKQTVRAPLQVFFGNAVGPPSSTAASAKLASLTRVPLPKQRPKPPKPIEGLLASIAPGVPTPAFRPGI